MNFKTGLITSLIVGLSLFLWSKKYFLLEDVFSKSEFSIYNERIKFGKALFFDKSLSINNKVSCATCHEPTKAFTDGKTLARGVYERKAFRNSASLINVKYTPYLMMDGAIPTLEMQALAPIQDHNEMGIKMSDLIHKLRKNITYVKNAKVLYNSELNPFVITKSLAIYQRSLIAKKSKFDLVYYQNKTNFSSKEQKGWDLFNHKFKCISCHSLPNFTNYELVNIGSVKNQDLDLGRYRITGDSLDIGKFKVPTLRNINLTIPYMHNGSMKTIEEAISMHYSQSLFLGQKDSRLNKKTPSKKELESLVLFLNTLTSK